MLNKNIYDAENELDHFEKTLYEKKQIIED